MTLQMRRGEARFEVPNVEIAHDEVLAGRLSPQDEVLDESTGQWWRLGDLLRTALNLRTSQLPVPSAAPSTPSIPPQPGIPGHQSFAPGTASPAPVAGWSMAPSTTSLPVASAAPAPDRPRKPVPWVRLFVTIGAILVGLGSWVALTAARFGGGSASEKTSASAATTPGTTGVDASGAGATDPASTPAVTARAMEAPEPKPVPQPPPPPSPSEQFLADVAAGRDLSSWCRKISSDLKDVCLGLARTAESGETDREARAAYERYLRNSGARKRSGYMVAKTDEGEYEVKMSGDRLHSLLYTTVTEFTSQGWFNKWVRKTGTRTVDTVNGFSQEWNEYEEDLVGGSIDFVRSAPRGEETSSTAQDALLLVIESGL